MTNENQQGDVLLHQTVDDGDILAEDGIVFMDAGIQTAAYISLFGGNEDDSGLDKDPHNWWGNIGERVKYRSETAYYLEKLPPTAPNLLRVEDAVKRDLQWLKDAGVVADIQASVTIPMYNKVKIVATLDNVDFTYTENWER